MKNIYFIVCIISILIILYYNYKKNLNNTNLNKKEKKNIKGGNERNKLKYGIEYFLYNHFEDIMHDGHIAGACQAWTTPDCGSNYIFQLYSLDSPQIKTKPLEHSFKLTPKDSNKINIEYGDMFWITMTGSRTNYHILNCKGEDVSISNGEKGDRTTYKDNSDKYNGSLFEIISPFKTTGQVMKNDKFILKLKNGKYMGKGANNREGCKSNSSLRIKYGISAEPNSNITNNLWSLIENTTKLTTSDDIIIIDKYYFYKKIQQETIIPESKTMEIKDSYFNSNSIVLKNITQDFYDVTHISNFVDIDFNYNEFELSFNINRIKLMITDLDGGILTMGTNKANYHNVFIYLKNTELIVGLMGYNTHISINLHKIKNSVSMYFRFNYKNPYLNVYVLSMDTNKNITKGYLDYLGNISDKMNTDFRLFLHPFLNSWCSIGTVNFIKTSTNENPTLLSATGILNANETTMSNLKLSHTKRNKIEIFKDTNISGMVNINTTHNIKNIILFNLKLNDGDSGGKLIGIYTKIVDGLELHREIINRDDKNVDKYIILSLIYDDNIIDLIKIKYNKTIDTCYIELVPYMDLHLFCIYLNNDFYKYVIDLSDLKKNKLYPDFANISINDETKLIKEANVYTEEFNYILGQRLVKLNPTVKKENGVLLINFKTNTKIEYIIPISKNNIVYSLSIRNPFENMWKNILKLNLNQYNKFRFKDENIIINDNRISNKYKLELTTNTYLLLPRWILNDKKFDAVNGTGNTTLVNKKENTDKILNYYPTSDNKLEGDIKLEEEIFGSTEWTLDYITEDLFKLETSFGKEVGDKKKFYDVTGVPNYFTKKKQKKKKKTFYISYIEKTEKTEKEKGPPMYIYYNSEGKLKSKKDNENCEFRIQPSNSLQTTDSLKDIIELYGIENPFPKLYLDNNNIEKSTQPCSYVHSDENIIFSHLPSKIINIEDVDFNIENREIDKIEADAIRQKKLDEKKCYEGDTLCEIIKGNMYDNIYSKLVNKIYNFCSNNLDHYNNKLYAYKYDKDRYYYQNNNEDNNYNNKKRVGLGKLSKEELLEALNMKQLRVGVDLINEKTKKKINNKSINNIYEIYQINSAPFKIDWPETGAFKSPLIVSLQGMEKDETDETGNTKKKIRNIKIIDNIFSDKSMEKYIELMKPFLKKQLDDFVTRTKSKNKKYLYLRNEGKICTEDEINDASMEPTKSCCDLTDSCKIKDLGVHKPSCNTVQTDILKEQTRKKIVESNKRIMNYVNDLIKKYDSSVNGINLNEWDNLYKFIKKNFDDNIIKNAYELTYLYNSNINTKKQKKSRRTINSRRNKRSEMSRGKNIGFGGNPINKINSSKKYVVKNIKMRGGEPRIKTYYKIYSKNPQIMIDESIESTINSQTQQVTQDFNDYNNKQKKKSSFEGPSVIKTLQDLYIHQMRPVVEYHKAEDENKNSWRLEWDGLYDPDTTEFQLFNLNEQKYLIMGDKNGMETIIWSDRKNWGKGWKLKKTTGVTDGNKITPEQKEKFKFIIKNQIDAELKTVFNTIIQDIITKTNSIALTAEIKHKDDLTAQLEDDRKKYITESTWLFSPNIGLGQFLISKTPKSGVKGDTDDATDWWMDFGPHPLTDSKFKFYNVVVEGEQGIKLLDGTTKNIMIGREGGGGGFLKNKITNKKDKKKSLVWSTPNDATKWELEFDEPKLEINLNTMYVPQPREGEIEILAKYVLIEDGGANVSVGNRISELDGTPWINEFMAIKSAEEKMKYGCIDYNWITEEGGEAVYYDDDYSTRGGNKNTATKPWYVLDKKIEITEKYLAITKLKYELDFAKWYSYEECFREKNGVCIDIRKLNWKVYGKKKGMNSWDGNIEKRPPKNEWTIRRQNMLNQLKSSINECKPKINKPMYVYLKGEAGYLKSNSFGAPSFTKTRTPEINGWYLLMDYDKARLTKETGEDDTSLKRFAIPQWLRNQKSKNTEINYTTELIPGEHCKGTYQDLPLKASNDSLQDCAKEVRKWQGFKGTNPDGTDKPPKDGEPKDYRLFFYSTMSSSEFTRAMKFPAAWNEPQYPKRKCAVHKETTNQCYGLTNTEYPRLPGKDGNVTRRWGFSWPKRDQFYDWKWPRHKMYKLHDEDKGAKGTSSSWWKSVG